MTERRDYHALVRMACDLVRSLVGAIKTYYTYGAVHLVFFAALPELLRIDTCLLGQHRLGLFISAVRRGSRANRQRVILIINLRLNTISLVYVAGLVSGVIGMQSHVFPTLPLDEIGIAFDAQHFAFDCLDAL